MMAISANPQMATSGKPRMPHPIAAKKTTAIEMKPNFERRHCRFIAEVMTT